MADVKQLNQSISEFLALQEGIVFGISSLQKNGLVVRLLGQKGEQLYNLLKDISTKLSLLKLDYAV
jgi:urease accessory protein UreH